MWCDQGVTGYAVSLRELPSEHPKLLAELARGFQA